MLESPLISSIVSAAAVSIALISLFWSIWLSRRKYRLSMLREAERERSIFSSVQRLPVFIRGAEEKLFIIESDNLMFRSLYPLLKEAVSRGVHVRILVPYIDKEELMRRADYVRSNIEVAMRQIKDLASHGMEVKILNKSIAVPTILTDKAAIVVPYLVDKRKSEGENWNPVQVMQLKDEENYLIVSDIFENMWEIAERYDRKLLWLD